MHVISKRNLVLFWTKHSDAEDALKAWYKEAEHAEWKLPAEIKARYHSADILPDNRVVLNIKGNHYRLILKIHYNTGKIFIRFVGTHAEYDKIDAEKI
ncbi:MAG: type II toxin-antitoxin system HigB family toxin [Chloroflexi bacterium]|nr:MAG: type II toxin-antitoxin system HigB family toxin [Chloroflexota bacterium]